MARGEAARGGAGQVPSVRARRRRWPRRVLLGLVAVALLPVLLTFAYTILRPPSLPMIGRWLTLQGAERRWIALSEVSPSLVVAVLTAEDARFCAHGGVDWSAMREVLGEADEDGPSRGASTLTMQTVKNLYLWPLPTLVRKGAEIPLSLLADGVLGKRRVLEIYLNVAEWGEGLYGAEAAARRHFAKPAKILNAREAALLAAALPSPRTRDPGKPGPRHRALAGAVTRRMASEALDTSCLVRG